jgi:hypothetical protein
MVWHDSVPASCVKFFGLGQALGYGIDGVTPLGRRRRLTVPTARVTAAHRFFDATGLALTLIGSNA